MSAKKSIEDRVYRWVQRNGKGTANDIAQSLNLYAEEVWEALANDDRLGCIRAPHNPKIRGGGRMHKLIVTIEEEESWLLGLEQLA